LRICLPQYRGKLVMPDASYHDYGAVVGEFVRSQGQGCVDKFIRDLAATKPLLVDSLTPAGERVTTGETPSVWFSKMPSSTARRVCRSIK
jgi:hypothetical protein